MRIFLTGGTGYIGAYLIRELVGAGHELTVLSRNPSACPGIAVQRGDLQHYDLARHDVLIHNAIWWEEEDELQDVRAAAQLFEAAAKAGIGHIVYTSSTAVHRPFRPLMNEETKIETADSYGATKAANEVFLSAICRQHGMRWNVVRPGPVVGPPATEGAPFKSDRTIARLAEAARKGGELRVGKGLGRQFVAADDLALLYRALLKADHSGETFLCVDRNTTLWESIARRLVEICGSKSEVVVEESKEASHRFDVTKIERTFGFRFDSSAAMTKHLEHLAQYS